MLALLDTVRDESGQDAPVRLVFEPKSSRIDQTEFVQFAARAYEPRIERVDQPGDDRRATAGRVRRASARSCTSGSTSASRRSRAARSIGWARSNDRIHILEGRMIVFLNIDEVIRIIRESDEPKPALMAAFGLSERQAEDILEIRLRQLARLESDQDRAGTGRTARRKGQARRTARQRRRDEAPAHQGNRRRREAIRRRPPHADPAGKARDVRSARGRRTGDGGRVAEGLGARAEGPRPRSGELPRSRPATASTPRSSAARPTR